MRRSGIADQRADANSSGLAGVLSRSDSGGDESNAWPAFAREGVIANSYAYNGDFFHKGAAGEPHQPRELPEVQEPGRLICVLESRASYPDQSDWPFDWPDIEPGLGWYQTHLRRSNWVFCDIHARSLPLKQTVDPVQLWRQSGDSTADQAAMVDRMHYLAAEYR